MRALRTCGRPALAAVLVAGLSVMGAAGARGSGVARPSRQTAAALTTGGVLLGTPMNRKVPPYGEADAVACPQGGGCVAVGSYDEVGGNAVALTWFRASGRWQKAYRVDLPHGIPTTAGSAFDGVACTAASHCAAAGTADLDATASHPSGTVALIAERVVGRVSISVVVPLPTGMQPPPNGDAADDTFPTPVWCVPGGSRCLIAGTALDGSGLLRPFTAQVALEHPSPGWVSDPSSLPFNTPPSPLEHWGDERVLGLSCTDLRDCVIVGAIGRTLADAEGFGGPARPFAQAETDGRWGRPVLVPMPGDAASTPLAELDAVTCVPATTSTTAACIAVGSYLRATYDTRPLVERYADAGWTLGTLPSVSSLPASAGLLAVGLGTVSCAADDACTAGGSVLTSQNTKTGRVYAVDAVGQVTGFPSVATVPNLPALGGTGTSSSVVRGIACPLGQSSCTAVGIEAGGPSEGTSPFAVGLVR